jgi:hypothetical protein
MGRAEQNINKSENKNVKNMRITLNGCMLPKIRATV